jgi:hypothetical protein
MSQQGASAADPFAQSPFKGLSSAMGEGAAAADAAGSFMDGLLGLGKGGAGELLVLFFLRTHSAMGSVRIA